MSPYFFFKANTEEARSIAQGLTLFTCNHFRLKPSYFYSYDELMRCMEGGWDFFKTSLLTLIEQDKKYTLDQLINTITVKKEVFISEVHRLVITVDNDNMASLDIRLIKEVVIHPSVTSYVDNEDISYLTGEKIESKAKSYAVEESKKVSYQYINTKYNLKATIVGKLQAQHDVTLLQLQVVSNYDGWIALRKIQLKF